MIKQLAFTRFIAAIAVVFFHYGTALSQPIQDLFLVFIKKGYVFVNYFFVLSGFVMIIAYSKMERINFVSFLQNRLARIYPIYLLSLLFIILIYFENKANFQDIFWNVLMVQTWIPAKALTLNFPSWSLSVELFFYVVFPCLFNTIYKKFSLQFSLVFAFSIWVISQIIYVFLWKSTTTSWFVYSFEDYNYLPLLHLNSFIIGNVTGLIYLNWKSAPNNINVKLIGLIFFIYICLQYELPIHNGLLSAFFAYGIYLFSKSTSFVTQFFSKNIFFLLGEISFGVYILQYPIFTIATSFRVAKYFNLDLQKDVDLIFLIKVIILLAVAVLSYYFIENPLRKLIRNLNSHYKA